MDFEAFDKIPRLSREVIVTEKVDGTNGVIGIERLTDTPSPNRADAVFQGPITSDVYVIFDHHLYLVQPGSRSRWLSEREDNFGFWKFVWENAMELVIKLGEGRHYGEWYGSGVNGNKYNLPPGEKRFMLFNTERWSGEASRPPCCEVSTVLFRGQFDELMGPAYTGCDCCYDNSVLDGILQGLALYGSRHVIGSAYSEGAIIFHHAGNLLFKKTILKDEEWKGSK